MESSVIHAKKKFMAPTLPTADEAMKTKTIHSLLSAQRVRDPFSEPLHLFAETADLFPQSSRNSCVHELFARQAAQTPHAKAVRWATGCLSYSELERQSNRLASFLRDQGISSGEPVGLFLDRSVEAIVGMLAILKAGGVYLPLDPTYPADRLAYMLEDAHPRMVLTHSRVRERFPQCAATPICVDKVSKTSAEGHGKHSSDKSLPIDHPAYIIYTSGSTGRPKGVLVGHRGLTNLAIAQINQFGIRAEDRVLQFASLNFDASVSEVWMTLLTGACLCLTPSDSLPAASDLEQILEEQAISVVTLTPSVLAVLRPLPLPALRTLIVAGEACPADLRDNGARAGNFSTLMVRPR